MKTVWNDTLRRLTSIENDWREITSSIGLGFALVGPWDIPIGFESIHHWMSDCKIIIEHAKSEGTKIIFIIMRSTEIQQYLSNMENFIASARGNSAEWLSSAAINLARYTLDLRTVLLLALPENSALLEYLSITNKDLAIRVKAIDQFHAEAAAKSQLVIHLAKETQAANAEAVQYSASTIGHEREASNARTNTEASANAAASRRSEVEALANEVSTARDEQRKLLEIFAAKRVEVDNLIKGANQAGLARSFQTRRERLEKVSMVWASVFVMGILAMLAVAGIGSSLVSSISGEVSVSTGGLLPIIVGGKVDFNALLSRFLVAGPLVWLTWFAARQYGNNIRLIEDYAFKESSAMAFVGYRDEMGDDPETLKTLRDIAAQNFGANPTRMLSGQEAASPMHELLDQTLQKGGIDKVIELLKALGPKAKE